MRIADLLISSSDRFPEKIAIIDENREITYEQLLARSELLAGSLQNDFGVKPGDSVGIWLQNRIEVIEAVVAINLIGAVSELYNALWSADIVRSLVSKGEVKLLFTENKDKFEQLFANRPNCPLVVIGDSVPETFCYEDVLAKGGNYCGYLGKSRDIAIDFFTSGTTGTPKCVMHTNEGIVLEELISSSALSWRHEDVMLTSFPFYHVGGLAIFAAFINGATTILSTATKADEIAKIIAKYRVTRAAFIPIILQRLLAECEKNPGLDLSSLRMVSYGSSTLSVQLLERCRKAFGCEFFQVYGMTETAGTVVILNEFDHRNPILLDSVGKPILGASVRVVHEDGTDCDPGEMGEIVLRSCTLMKGYRGMPELTEKVLSDGWYHTRDTGYLDERGYLRIRGRLDGMIISGGENIFPQEIQSCILDMGPDILDAAVIGIKDKKWGQCPVAFVVTAPNASLGEDDIRDYCGERLGRYKRPKYVHFVDKIPRGGTGKINFHELRDHHDRIMFGG